MTERLFNSGHLHQFLREKEQELEQEVLALLPDYLLNASEHDICVYFVDKYTIEPLKIKVEEKEIVEERPIQLQRPDMWGSGGMVHMQGQLIVLAVPFDGDPELLKLMPSSFMSSGVPGEIVGNEIHVSYECVDNNQQQLQSSMDNSLSVFSYNATNSKKDVDDYNRNIAVFAKRVVAARKQVLLQQRNLVHGLNIPVRKRDGVSQTYAMPTIKRKPRIERPVVGSGTYEQEPTLAMEDYEYILGVVQNMAVMLERSPATFAKLDEEEIRDHFLVHLNGHYEGRATGETFNQDGKTDIIIKENGRNAFIAECKFWEGPKAFPAIINQLLGYTCWRDTKTAILLFNRNKDTTKVLDQIPELVKGHPNFKREKPGKLDETRFRYIFHQPGDANRELYLTICVYDIPARNK